jgi:hypothetical protein
MSHSSERSKSNDLRKPETIDVNDLTDEDDNSANPWELARRAVADATKAFKKFENELN